MIYDRLNKTLITALSIFAVAGCTGDDNSSSNNSNDTNPKHSDVLTGKFLVTSPVQNISYKTNSQAGNTNSKGQFNYKAGETITFSIGDLKLPSLTSKESITPLDIAKTTKKNNAKVINISRLLLTLDKDSNADNGILITDAAKNVATQVNFDLNTTDFENSTPVKILITNASQDTPTTELVSVDSVLKDDTMEQSQSSSNLTKYVGIWKSGGDSELILDKEGKFKYSESDGIETGTYTIDSTKQKITFNILDDGNNPGKNSGIGDANEPKAFDITLSDDQNTLTLKLPTGDSVVFNRA